MFYKGSGLFKKRKVHIVKAVRFFSGMLVLLLLLVAPALAGAEKQGTIIAPKLIQLPPVAFSETINTEYAGRKVYVKLKIRLSESGAVSEDGIKILESSGNDAIDQAVIDAVKGASFSPAYKDGVAVSAAILFPLQIQVPEKPREKPGA